ncbi:MAG: hypothetical protein ACPHID_05945 [Thermoplasmatota archaeon]
MRVLAVLCLLLLTGCLGLDPGRQDPPGQQTTSTTSTTTAPAPTPGVPPAGPIALLLDFEYTGCEGFEANVLVPTADAQTLLPEGYTADELPGVDSTPVQYRFVQCDFRTPTAQVNQTIFGSVAIGLASSPVEGDAYLLQMLTQEDVMAQLWTAAGYALHTGVWSRTVTGDAMGGPLGLHDVSLGDYQAQVVASTTGSASSGFETYLTETEQGRLVWTMTETVEAEAVATGSFTAPEPLAQDGTQSGLRVLLDVSYTDIDLFLTP